MALKCTECETVLYSYLDEGAGMGIFMDDSLFKGEHGLGSEICCILYCGEGCLSLAALQDGRQQGQLVQKAKLLGLLESLLNLLDTRKVYLAEKLLLPDCCGIGIIPDQNFATVLWEEVAFYQGLLATFICLNEVRRVA